MATERDPFDDLRLPQVPLAVDPAFAARLRRLLEAALTAPPDPETDVTMTDPSTTTTAAATIGSTTLVPYLAVAGAPAAIDWYRDVFGAIETLRFVGDDGRIGHAELTIGDAKIMLADEYPEIGVVGPTTLGNTSVALHLEVVDVDHTYGRAIEAGAVSLTEPGDQTHGNRNATITDPFGHRWMISQPIDADRIEAAKATDTRNVGFTVTDRTPVEPGYLVLHSADIPRSTAFFGALFGWEALQGQHGGHIANTKFPMGLAGPVEGRSTTVYFRVDDIAPYAARVVELGGRVLQQTEYDSGGNAECEDDQGYRFDLWKPAPGY